MSFIRPIVVLIRPEIPHRHPNTTFGVLFQNESNRLNGAVKLLDIINNNDFLVIIASLTGALVYMLTQRHFDKINDPIFLWHR